MNGVPLVVGVVAVVSALAVAGWLGYRARARARGVDALTRARRSGAELSAGYVRRRDRRRRERKDFADKTIGGAGAHFDGSDGGIP